MNTMTVGKLFDMSVQYYADAPAIRHMGKTTTYREMGLQADCLTRAFRTIKLRKGERVAFLTGNCPEYIICEYAVSKAGLVKVPLAALLKPEAHIYMLNHSEASVLIYHEKMAGRVKEMIPHLDTVKHYICVGTKSDLFQEDHFLLSELLQDANTDKVEEEDIQPEDLFAIYYTGGTTGRPKGVLLSNKAWVNTVVLEMLELGFEREEVFACMTPLTHGAGCLILPILLRKGTCLILDGFDPDYFLEMVEKEKITSTFIVPTMVYILLEHPQLHTYNLQSLRNLVYGASAIAPERLKQAIDIFGPIFTQLYGQTEAPMMISVLPKEDHVIANQEREKQIFTSCGRPTILSQVKIVDENMKEVPQGEVGEILSLSPNVMDGYYKDREATEETLKNNWLCTGDLGWQDQAGYLYIVDRLKDMIVSGGFNVYPREIEDVLHEHPSVSNVAVIGVPHDKWGEAVKAVVHLNKEVQATEQEIIDFVKERKGSLAAPKSVDFWDQIPLTNLGKIDKKKIREFFWQDRDRKV